MKLEEIQLLCRIGMKEINLRFTNIKGTMEQGNRTVRIEDAGFKANLFRMNLLFHIKEWIILLLRICLIRWEKSKLYLFVLWLRSRWIGRYESSQNLFILSSDIL